MNDELENPPEVIVGPTYTGYTTFHIAEPNRSNPRPDTREGEAVSQRTRERLETSIAAAEFHTQHLRGRAP